MQVGGVRRRAAAALVVVLGVGGGVVLGACSDGSSTTTATSTTALAATPAGVAGAPEAELALVAAVGDRLVLAIDVAESKWNSGAPIEDVAREEQAVTAIEAAATAAGLDPTLAADALQAQIEASKVVQRSLHEQWTGDQHPPFADTVDLVNDLRPRLDAATQAMVDAMAAGGGAIPADRLAEHERQLAALLDGVPAAVAAARTALAPFASSS